MIASSPDQDRDRFVFLATPDRNHCLLLKFNVYVVIDGAGECAQTLLPCDAAEICNRTLPQLQIFFAFSNANDVSLIRAFDGREILRLSEGGDAQRKADSDR